MVQRRPPQRAAGTTAELVDGENDFAEVLGLFEVVVGGGALVEGPDLVHDGNKTALRNELEDGAQLVLGAHVGAENGKLAGEEETDIEFGVEAGGGAAGDQATGGGQALEAFAEGGFADVLENDIHAAVVGEAANFLGNRHDAMMNDLVSAELPGFGNFLVVAGGGNHAAAEEFGDLDGGAADTAAGGENKHIFARLELRAIDEHVPGGLEDKRNGGGMGPIEVFGIGHAIDFGTADEFGAATINHVAEIGKVAAAVVIAGKAGGTFAAGDAGSEHDFLADMHGADFRTDLGDFAGDIAARDVREWNLEARKAAAHPQVEMIEGTGTNTDKHFVAAKLGLRDVSIVENRRVTMFLEDDGFHERPPRSEMRWRLTTGKYIVSR